jgi:hypothetical protein
MAYCDTSTNALCFCVLCCTAYIYTQNEALRSMIATPSRRPSNSNAGGNGARDLSRELSPRSHLGSYDSAAIHGTSNTAANAGATSPRSARGGWGSVDEEPATSLHTSSHAQFFGTNSSAADSALIELAGVLQCKSDSAAVVAAVTQLKGSGSGSSKRASQCAALLCDVLSDVGGALAIENDVLAQVRQFTDAHALTAQ